MEHLPDAGGIYDQDYVTMQRMNAALKIYRTVMAYRSAKGDAIHKMPADIARVMKGLRRDGYV